MWFGGIKGCDQMSTDFPHLTLISTWLDERVEKYDVGMSLEDIIQKCTRELLDAEVEDHFVFEHGPDLHFSFDGGTCKGEILNWKQYLKMIPKRFRRILKNLKGASVKVIICSFIDIFTREQLRILRKKRIHVLSIGFQLLPPDYFEKNTNWKCRIRRFSKRTFFLIKNRILSLFSRIPRLKSILYSEGKIGHTIKNRSMNSHETTLSNIQNASIHKNHVDLIPNIRCLIPLFAPVVSLTCRSSFFDRLKRGLIRVLDDVREIDEVLMLFTFFHGILLRLVLTSDIGLIRKISLVVLF